MTNRVIIVIEMHEWTDKEDAENLRDTLVDVLGLGGDDYLARSVITTDDKVTIIPAGFDNIVSTPPLSDYSLDLRG